MAAIKAAAKFSSNRGSTWSRRGRLRARAPARDLSAREAPATSCSPFCYCYRALGAGASRGDIYSRHRGVMPAVSRGETL